MNDQRQAVILAAGQGTRLQALTTNTPQTLLEVGEHSILERIFQALEANGYECAIIVTGFESKQIKDHCTLWESLEIEFINNEEYASTNNTYSLWLAREYAVDGFTLINADTIFSPESLEKLRQANESALLVDTEKELEDEEMQIAFDSNHIETSGKDLSGDGVGVYLNDGDGEYIGVSRGTEKDASILFDYIGGFIERGEVNEWYKAAFDCLFDDTKIGYVRIKGPWAEIDTRTDLEHARTL